MREDQAPPPGGEAAPHDALRRWLSLLDQPDRLNEPGIVALLQAQGRMPADGSSGLSVGRAAVALFTEKIEAMRPPPGAGREQGLPYVVLKTCFVDGMKLVPAATRLGMSQRQLTRERTRALQMLAAELHRRQEPARPRYRPEPIPAILGFVPRPAVSRELASEVVGSRLVHVHGPRGIGKTSLVAELANEAQRATPVLWHRFRPGVNDSLHAFLFEVGEFLADRGMRAVADYIGKALPAPDTTLAARLVVRELRANPQLWVLDDFHIAEEDAGLRGFLEEAVARTAGLRVVTVGRHTEPSVGISFAVPMLSVEETATLLAQLAVEVTATMATRIHEWTNGVPQLVRFAASWLRNLSPEDVDAFPAQAFTELDEVQEFLLDSLTTEVIDSADRAVLNAASVFRDRFSDDGLAFVADRTRGAVQDTSRRLVRNHLATRGRLGDVAFFHASVRDYVYARLDPQQRAELHGRAADWYEQAHGRDEAAYHRGLALEAERQLRRPSARPPAR